jgi:hypothetical protein
MVHWSDEPINPTEYSALKPWQHKLLLEQIEETNQPVQDFNLLHACNCEPRIFGVAGTELRRLYQYRFKYLKSLPIDRYVRFLRKYGQNPSATTQRLLLEATNTAFETLSFDKAADTGTIEPPRTDDEDTGTIEPPLTDDEGTISDTSKDEEEAPPAADDEEASQEGTVYSNIMPEATWNSEFSSPMVRSPAPFSSPMRTMAGPSPVPSVTTSSAPGAGSLATGTNQQYLDHWVQPPQGTVDDPYRINVDLLRPEKNREFDIAYIPMKTVKGYARNVVHIRVDSAPGDHQLWEMTVPHGALRQLLIRGPSRSLHYSDEEKFHRKKNCSVTYGIHAMVADDIERSPGRKFSYWLLQFPPEIILDNGVFSDDQIEVSRNKVGLSFTEQETGIKGISSNCMMVSWEIAEKKAGLRVETKEKEEDDAACFD